MRGWILILVAGGSVSAAEPIVLRESLPNGTGVQVATRAQLKGTLNVPVEKDQPPKLVKMEGTSAMRYAERSLSADAEFADSRCVRLYDVVDLKRTIGDQEQATGLRDEVRRVVLLRKGDAKTSFSPDGPLTYAEIDLLRTELMTSRLIGLLPANAVRPGDTWKATAAAVTELTDMDHVEAGDLTVKFEELTTVQDRPVAHLSFQGELRGVNEDGPTRQELTGRCYFDLTDRFLQYVSLTGKHLLLDKDGKETGRIEGTFVLVRKLGESSALLSDAQLSRLTLKPTDANTTLLHEDLNGAVRFAYPRRWKVNATRGRQITLDDAAGNGLLITVDDPGKVLTTEAFVQETRTFFAKQGGRVERISAPVRREERYGDLEQISMQTDGPAGKVRMDYWLCRQAFGTAVLALRPGAKDADKATRDAEEVARSFRLSNPRR